MTCELRWAGMWWAWAGGPMPPPCCGSIGMKDAVPPPPDPPFVIIIPSKGVPTNDRKKFPSGKSQNQGRACSNQVVRVQKPHCLVC
eukprot:m.351958 g.351958  ORF g.351958 m.351958 type:complete len:86 (-) comp27986_c0_seq1:181-438(-)